MVRVAQVATRVRRVNFIFAVVEMPTGRAVWMGGGVVVVGSNESDERWWLKKKQKWKGG